MLQHMMDPLAKPMDEAVEQRLSTPRLFENSGSLCDSEWLSCRCPEHIPRRCIFFPSPRTLYFQSPNFTVTFNERRGNGSITILSRSGCRATSQEHDIVQLFDAIELGADFDQQNHNATVSEDRKQAGWLKFSRRAYRHLLDPDLRGELGLSALFEENSV